MRLEERKGEERCRCAQESEHAQRHGSVREREHRLDYMFLTYPMYYCTLLTLFFLNYNW